jgi:hypothetical protein
MNSTVITLQGVANCKLDAEREIHKKGLDVMHIVSSPSENAHVLLQCAIRTGLDNCKCGTVSVICSTAAPEAPPAGSKRTAAQSIDSKTAFCVLHVSE